MAYRATKIGMLATFQPSAARAEIVGAFEKARGSAVAAAAKLGISRRQFDRLVKDLELEERVERIRRKHKAAA